MAANRIVVADSNMNYLLTLQMKLVEEVRDGIQVDAFSDAEKFAEYFSVPRDISCLIVSEELFSQDLAKHNISKIVLLSNDRVDDEETNEKIRKVYKYSSLREIYNQIKDLLSDDIGNNEIVTDRKSKILAFFSASGGVGKTALAISMSKHLADKHYRVLYINAESIQSIQSYMGDDYVVPDRVMMELETSNESAYEVLKKSIRRESFSYIPQFPAPLAFYSMGRSIYPRLVHDASISKAFDYIIVDMDSAFDDATAEILKLSEKVFFIVNQDEVVVDTTTSFVKSIDQPSDQYAFISNNYLGKELSEDSENGFAVDQYINHFAENGKKLIDKLSQSESLLKLSLLID